MSEDIDVKVKEEELEVVALEDGRCANINLINFVPPPINYGRELTWEPGKDGQPSSEALRKRRARQYETAEKRRARLDRENERRRRKRQTELSNHPEQEIQRSSAEDVPLSEMALRIRLLRQNETADKRRARLDRENERRKLKRQSKTHGQKCERLEQQHRKVTFESKWKHITDEELSEEVKKILQEKRDKWGHKVKWDEGPDGKLLMTRKELENVKTAYKNFLLKKQKEKQMSAEERAQMKETERFQKLVKKAHMTEEERSQKRLEAYLRRHAYEANMPEEKRQKQRQRHIASCRRYFQNMSEEQRERVRNSQRKAIKKYMEKNKEKLRGYYQEKSANQTPERRQKSLQYQRINQARRLLKRKLEAVGATQEEIQSQVDQLVSKMKSEPLPPLEQVSTYKPRPRKKQRPEMETSSSEIHDQDCHNLNIRSATPQIVTSFGSSLSQNLEGDDDVSSSHLDPPSPPLSQSGSISQDQKSREILEEDETEDNKHHYDNIVAPTNSPISPNPTFDSEQKGLVVKAISVTKEENVTNVENSPPRIMSSAAPSILTISEPLLNEKQCPHCPLSFPEDCQLKSHVHSTHQSKCWKCPKCSSVVLSSNELREHFKSHHARPEQEDVDHKIATTTETEGKSIPKCDQHIGRETFSQSVKTLPFICMKCPVLSSKSQFKMVDKLLDHVRISHPKAFWPCPQCKLLKYNDASLKIHSKICTKSLNG